MVFQIGVAKVFQIQGLQRCFRLVLQRSFKVVLQMCLNVVFVKVFQIGVCKGVHILKVFETQI